jgi:hypothetical protein
MDEREDTSLVSLRVLPSFINIMCSLSDSSRFQACWSADGAQIYAGRRNGTVEVWDVRQLGRSGPSNTPRLLKTLRNPLSSGVVSCVVAFPDGHHIAW